MKTIGYIRVSTDGQVKEGVSLENQEEKIRRYCDYKGFSITEIIRDEGISGGKNSSRPGFMKLLDMIQAGNVEVLVLYSLDRLSRDMLTLLALERYLDEFDVKLHTVEGEINTETPDGFMNFAMRAFLGEMERRQVKYRTKKALDYKKSQGKVTGQVPYGWKREGNDLVENPQEMEIIRRINRLYSAGKNLTEISGTLEEDGITTRKGTKFSVQQVKRLIDNYQDVKVSPTSKIANGITELIKSMA